MFDPRTREDLTQKRLDVALKVDFKSLPLRSRGQDGARRWLARDGDVRGSELRLLQAPVAKHGGAEERDDLHVPVSDSVCRIRWRNQRRSGARRIALQAGTSTWCRTRHRRRPRPIARIRSSRTSLWASNLGINGTPTIVFADGTRTAGAMPVPAIEQRLACRQEIIKRLGSSDSGVVPFGTSSHAWPSYF